MQLKESKRRRLWRLGRSVMPLCLALVFLLVMLSGCAVKPIQPAVDCPQTPQLPANLKGSSLPAVQGFSKEARSWFDEVSSFLSELR